MAESFVERMQRARSMAQPIERVLLEDAGALAKLAGRQGIEIAPERMASIMAMARGDVVRPASRDHEDSRLDADLDLLGQMRSIVGALSIKRSGIGNLLGAIDEEANWRKLQPDAKEDPLSPQTSLGPRKEGRALKQHVLGLFKAEFPSEQANQLATLVLHWLEGG
jgi:hypothetical protein